MARKTTAKKTTKRTGKKTSKQSTDQATPMIQPLFMGGENKIPTVVYIHGIANKPAPSVLKREWDFALFECDMAERTRMAYWADIRYPQPRPTGTTEISSLEQSIDAPTANPFRDHSIHAAGYFVREEIRSIYPVSHGETVGISRQFADRFASV